MKIQQAIDMVSYKLALKNGEAVLNDPLLNPDRIRQAIHDKQHGTEAKVDLKLYMQATKLLKQHRSQLFKQENEAFLVAKASETNIQSTSSGLLYKEITTGSGAFVSLEDSITVHYEGQLIDGTVFDSSFERDKPTTFLVKKVIKGWQEGLQLMNTGAELELYLPQELAYGDRGYDSKVPPHATLVFKIQLLAIEQ